jgi:hypothetical protein
MRHIVIIFGVVLGSVLFVHGIYEFCTEDAGILYFSSHPDRMVYVMLLAVSGGLIALGISRLSPDSQRRLKLFALGGFGTILVAGLGFFAYLLWVLPDGSVDWAEARFVGGAWTAGLVWTEFRKLWRKPRESGQPEH